VVGRRALLFGILGSRGKRVKDGNSAKVEITDGDGGKSSNRRINGGYCVLWKSVEIHCKTVRNGFASVSSVRGLINYFILSGRNDRSDAARFELLNIRGTWFPDQETMHP